MSILGLDYGRSRIGIALADGPLAQPLRVIRATDKQKLTKEIARLIDQNKVTQIVIGVSEGAMGRESEEFAGYLKETFSLPVDLVDETLTSVEAQKKMIAGGKRKKARKDSLDAVAAALILQSWLDK